jgi:hypothetical protein
VSRHTTGRCLPIVPSRRTVAKRAHKKAETESKRRHVIGYYTRRLAYQGRLGLEIFHGAPVSRAAGRVAVFAVNTKGSTVAIQSRLTEKSKFSVDFRFLHLPGPWQDQAPQSGIVPGS